MNKIKELYISGKSGIEISKILKIKLGTVYYHLKKMNITRSNKVNSVKYSHDHSCFSIIDSEESAYWLGFMYADGYIISRNTGQKSIGISLSSKDYSHIEKFRSFLKSDNPIHNYVTKNGERYSRLLITSESLFNNLSKTGCTERKTFKIVFPDTDIVPLKFRNNFILGYFDGDGSLSYVTKSCQYKFRLCGTSSFLNSVLIFFKKSKHRLYKRWKDEKDNWSIDIGGNRQVLEIMNILYDNTDVFLERKYNRYLKLKSLYSEKNE